MSSIGHEAVVFNLQFREGKKNPHIAAWRVDGVSRTKSFRTKALAAAFRDELVRQAKRELFDPQTGLPVSQSSKAPTFLLSSVDYYRAGFPTWSPKHRQGVEASLLIGCEVFAAVSHDAGGFGNSLHLPGPSSTLLTIRPWRSTR